MQTFDKEWSETWGADLRGATHSERSEAVRTVLEQCRRAGLNFRHRAKGWSIEFPTGWRHYWPDEINLMVDQTEAYLTVLLAEEEESVIRA